MSWATRYIDELQSGRTVEMRPVGHSMSGRINHRQLVTIVPVPDTSTVKIGDIVLCSVRGRDRLHLIKAIRDGSFLIANNHGHENGWTRTVYGVVTEVRD